MHLNKNHTISRRALAMLLTLTLCFSLVPSAFAAQQNSYHDPAEHWMRRPTARMSWTSTAS